MAGQPHAEDRAAPLLQVPAHHHEFGRQSSEAMNEQDSRAAPRKEKGLSPFHDHP